MLYFPISHLEIAGQIAELINNLSDLSKQRTADDILKGKTHYVVETHGKFVIGAVGIHKVSYELSELKHLVVHPDWRGRSLGHFISKRALSVCGTPSIYATVRTSNLASLKSLTRSGFVKSHERIAGEHRLAVLIRAAPKCQVITSASRQTLSSEQG